VIVNAILCVLRTGCQWRLLPNDFPPWPVVHDRCRRRRLRGYWERALDAPNASSRKRSMGKKGQGPQVPHQRRSPREAAPRQRPRRQHL